jgi:hypothetical protein
VKFIEVGTSHRLVTWRRRRRRRKEKFLLASNYVFEICNMK